ncbi:glycosyltransferase family 4 protein [Selenomonas bovis]|uniref:glycosyltransferase family 4 protein n=1 Tax=Selenomonas bovis TaxID=416586 RepID=UPI003D049A2B
MKKIVLFINSMAQSGGIERVTATLSNIFVNQGHDVTIVVIEKDTSCFYSLDDRVKVQSLMIEPFKNKVAAVSYYIKAIVRFRKCIKDARPDIIMAIWTNRALMSIIANYGLKAKVICCEHIAYRELRLALRIVRPLFYRHAAAVVSLTQNDVKYYEKINDTVAVIPNPIPEINLPEEKRRKVILAVGRLVPQKGFDLLLRIWKQIHEKYPEWRLVIIGHKLTRYEKYANALYGYVKSNNMGKSVDFHDHTTKIYECYKRASIYAMTSRYEGLPMVLLEAMRCGLPVVSYDCPTGPREIIKDGITGELVTNGNEAEFIDKLCGLMNNEKQRARIGREASKDIQQGYSSEAVYKKWENLFESI